MSLLTFAPLSTSLLFRFFFYASSPLPHTDSTECTQIQFQVTDQRFIAYGVYGRSQLVLLCQAASVHTRIRARVNGGRDQRMYLDKLEWNRQNRETKRREERS
jgi:hypothetical protein